MSTFDDSKHPRGQRKNAGQFRAAENDAPSRPLGGERSTAGPLRVNILSSPDPAGGFDTSVDAPTGRHFMREGVRHREDGPAYVGRDGSEAWYRNGQLHRDPHEGPALIEEDHEEFYDHGQLVNP